jgi:hypothetical protein
MVSRSIVDMSLILKFLKAGLCLRGSRMYRHVLIMFIMKSRKTLFIWLACHIKIRLEIKDTEYCNIHSLYCINSM